MFEAVICGFVAFAVGYTVLMRIMARRADVLYGQFIHGRQPAAAVSWLVTLQSYLHGARLPVRR